MAKEDDTTPEGQNGVDDNSTYCAYCGFRIPIDDEAATEITKHIYECEKHPMHTVIVRERLLTAALEAISIPTVTDEDGNLWLQLKHGDGQSVAFNMGKPGKEITKALNAWMEQRNAALRSGTE